MVTRPKAGIDPSWATILVVLLVACGVQACGSSPPIQYYQPQIMSEFVEQGQQTDVRLGVETFSADAGYSDQRIVYRTSPYRFNYYHYHRWSAPPGLLVTDLIRQAFRETDRFASVTSGYASRPDATVTGRVLSFEEVDREDGWYGRVVLELSLRDPTSGENLWSREVGATQKLEERSPEGLAKALSQAISEVASKTTPMILEAVERRADES